jgi:DNA-binding Lrp family transcriptional regulator
MGGMPDKKLSEIIGCSEDTVINRRRKLKIQAHTHNFIDWVVWDDKLGKETDQSLALEINCTAETVRKRRKELRIKSFGESGHRGKPRKIDWEPWDKYLGTASDWEVAKKMGCSVSPVRRRRAKLNIPAFNRHAVIDWAQWDKELGKAHDRETAALAGCSLIAVEQRRERLGIKPYSKNDRIDWATWDSVLGKSNDRVVSEHIGCSVSSVARRRKKLDIPSFLERSARRLLRLMSEDTKAEKRDEVIHEFAS